MEASGWAVFTYVILLMISIGVFGWETMMSGIIFPLTVGYIVVVFGCMYLWDWFATRRSLKEYERNMHT